MNRRHSVGLALLVASALVGVVGSGSASANGSRSGATYVALGDSYAAGEGLPAYESGTDSPNRKPSLANLCHRSSSGAYASLSRGTQVVLPDVPDRAFWACSGATSVQMLVGSSLRHSEPKPLSTVGRETRWISISAGADDLNLPNVARACVKVYSAGVSKPISGLSKVTCAKQLATSQAQLSVVQDAVRGTKRATGLYQSLLDRSAPNSVLAVVGYPKVFPSTLRGFVERNGKRFCATNVFPLPQTVVGFESTDAAVIDRNLIQADNRIALSAVSALRAKSKYANRIRFVDTYNSPLNRPLSCDGSDVDGITVKGVELAQAFTGLVRGITNGTFHPTQAGADMTGRLIQAAFNDARPLRGVTQISAGFDQTCALLTAGAVRCWGGNSYGQLGDGTIIGSALPVEVSGLGAATQVSAGNLRSCSVLVGGSVDCWGLVGHPADFSNAHVATPIGGVTNALQVALGVQSSCALTDGGVVECWGYMLGGSFDRSATPQTIAGLSGATQFSVGFRHACAVTVGGAATCVGLGNDGQLGDGSITDAKQVSAGSRHTCIVTTGGAVKCWGWNVAGQLGDGTTNNSSSPVVATGVTGATQVASGSTHTCAIVGKAAVKCWGSNLFGQLGDGTTVNSNVPVSVRGISGAVQITTGQSHSCALLKAGTVKCWGRNNAAQLGDYTDTLSTVPVTVRGP